MALYKNKSIVLRPGENTTIIMSSVNTTGTYLANTLNNNMYDYFNTTVMPWPVMNEQVYTFTNYMGFAPKVPFSCDFRCRIDFRCKTLYY